MPKSAGSASLIAAQAPLAWVAGRARFVTGHRKRRDGTLRANRTFRRCGPDVLCPDWTPSRPRQAIGGSERGRGAVVAVPGIAKVPRPKPAKEGEGGEDGEDGNVGEGEQEGAAALRQQRAPESEN